MLRNQYWIDLWFVRTKVGASITTETLKEYRELKKEIKASRDSHPNFDEEFAAAMRPSKQTNNSTNEFPDEEMEDVDEDLAGCLEEAENDNDEVLV